MAALTWNRAADPTHPNRDLSARDPRNWTPNATPQPGDTLTMLPLPGDVTPTMDIRDNDLAGNTLTIGGQQATSQPSENFVLNVHGIAKLTEQTFFPPIGVSSVTINLIDHAIMVGGFTTAFAPLFIKGDDGKFSNIHSSVAGARVEIDPRVIGKGDFHVGSAQSAAGSLEFKDAVGGGQTIAITGDPERGAVGSIQVDHPKDFHASVSLGFGEVLLEGLKADSYAFHGDMLLLFKDSKVVDTVRLHVTPEASNFHINQASVGVIIHGDDTARTGNNSGTVLMQHMV